MKRNLSYRAEVLEVPGLYLQDPGWGMDGGGPGKRKIKVNSVIPRALRELLMSKSAEHFLLKTPKIIF